MTIELVFLGAFAAAAFLSCWPLLLRKWKFVPLAWLAATLIIVAIGAWWMVYYQIEQEYIRRAEAKSLHLILETWKAEAPSRFVELGEVLHALTESEEFRKTSSQRRYQLWNDAIVTFRNSEGLQP